VQARLAWFACGGETGNINFALTTRGLFSNGQLAFFAMQTWQAPSTSANG
jgi:hypothetical protein